MTEKKLITGGTIKYSGYFKLSELYTLIEQWTAERGFDKDDKLHEVKVKEEGQYIELDLQPAKQISDYVKFVIQIRATFSKITEEKIVIDEHETTMNKGDATILVQGMILTDFEGDWKSRPAYQIWKTIFDKFVFKTDLDTFEDTLKKNVAELKHEISSYLNLQKFVSSQGA